VGDSLEPFLNTTCCHNQLATRSLTTMFLGTAAGALCQALFYSSTIFGALSNVTLEFTTPRAVAPTSLFFCLSDPHASLDSSSFAVHQLVEGGTIFSSTGEAQLVPFATTNSSTAASNSGNASVANSTATPWSSAPFFLPSSSPSVALAAAEFGGLRDVLYGDAAYSTGFAHQRRVNLSAQGTSHELWLGDS
jgi:hypothetical protein